jgi:hypothetical protein
MKRVTLASLLLVASVGYAGEPTPQATTEVLELRKALYESQIQVLLNALREVTVELEKRKAAENPKIEEKKK